MSMKKVLTEALNPYVDSLGGWTTTQIESLFLGLGNISVFNASDEDYLPVNNLAGTHNENAEAIIDALNELGVPHNFDAESIYWLIDSCAGEVREDLRKAMEDAGFVCYDYFNPDSEDEGNHQLTSVNTFNMAPILELNEVVEDE